MEFYDYKKAKAFIEKNKENIKYAKLGIHEDWFWTAGTVYEENEFTENLDDKDLKINFINGSCWGTPVLNIEYENGENKTYKCEKKLNLKRYRGSYGKRENDTRESGATALADIWEHNQLGSNRAIRCDPIECDNLQLAKGGA